MDISSSKAGDRILFMIKTKGPASTASLARQLGITPEAARQQVQKLVSEGLIDGRPECRASAGRPRQVWALTAAGFSRFPDAHSQLAVQLLSSVRVAFGDDGLELLLARRDEESLREYRRACGEATDTKTRLHRLAEARTAEGYMARVETDGQDLLLIEDHCPICAAASACQGFCSSELQVFQEVLGPSAFIRRIEHLQAGGHRCVYRISPK